ncbi:PREDICTED: eukaryotic translation initiation factor 3 subunit B-like [Hipposideros armiger]|uniref:Eukaryotic translation initiation factor 3 subunit B-like n=1 Tax=Hipposideros armiger TaxID=186990 RepID=A0A8B7QW86_HIPAR|nr:PREDICTED: eukaryotic translation initiation factor 3 subunit B-like [Hipposideros armiger]
MLPFVSETFDKQQANTIFWSPQGQFVVLAGLRSMNGALAFVDTSDCTVMNIAEHYMASDVEWDPTGRYVITSVSWWSHKVDNAYWLWTFQGRLLQKNNKDRFCQLLWRPRPPTLLSQDQIKVWCPSSLRGRGSKRKSFLLSLSGWSERGIET